MNGLQSVVATPARHHLWRVKQSGTAAAWKASGAAKYGDRDLCSPPLRSKSMFEITEDMKAEAIKAMQVVLLESAATIKGDEEEVLGKMFDAAVRVVKNRFGL